MTCIVGLEHEGKVYMGGDSAAVSRWDMTRTRLKKVFRRGTFLVGYTTSFRMGQLLQYRLAVPKREGGMDPLEYMATVFVDAVRACLKEGGVAKIENAVEEGGSFLVGYEGVLYHLESDFQVNYSQDGFMAVGCGAPYALGALHQPRVVVVPETFPMLSSENSKAQTDADPALSVYMALASAGHFSIGVSAPYYVEVLA